MGDALRAKTVALGERQNEFIASENNLLKANQEKGEATEHAQGLGDQSKELRSALAESQQGLTEVSHLRSRFEAIATGGAASLDPSSASVEAPAATEEAAAEEPA